MPYAPQFGDVYCSREGGAEEKRTVFIEGNGLLQRFAALGNKQAFTILETGFGTGLNFLLTVEAWQQRAGQGGWLFYLGVENHPFRKADLAGLHTEFLPERLMPLALQLQARWPALIPGFHWVVFPQWRVTLLLMFEPLERALWELQAEVDGWFLDGFSPAKNPDMWCEALYAGMRRLSRPGATFATYSAALGVRHGVEQAGFAWQKRKGFGHKKHMLTGAFGGEHVPKPIAQKNIAIIGGGLAGCTAAHVLSRYGMQVTFYERHGALAQEASGNPAAIMKPYMAKEWSAQTLLYNQAFYHSRDLAQALGLFNGCGAVQLATEPPRHLQLGLPLEQAVELSAAECSARLGLKVDLPGSWQPEAGWMNPAAFCEALMQHSGAEQRMTEAVKAIPSSYDAVVVANAFQAQQFPELQSLPLIPMRGQITVFERKLPLQCIANYGGYALPHGAYLTLGSTYDRRDMAAEVRSEDDNKNISEYNKHFTYNPVVEKPLFSRVAWRTTTPSKRPIVGHVTGNIYASLGLASRGALLASYLAEQLASEMLGLPQPMQKSVKQLLLQDVIKTSVQR